MLQLFHIISKHLRLSKALNKLVACSINLCDSDHFLNLCPDDTHDPSAVFQCRSSIPCQLTRACALALIVSRPFCLSAEALCKPILQKAEAAAVPLCIQMDHHLCVITQSRDYHGKRTGRNAKTHSVGWKTTFWDCRFHHTHEVRHRGINNVGQTGKWQHREVHSTDPESAQINTKEQHGTVGCTSKATAAYSAPMSTTTAESTHRLSALYGQKMV